MKQYIRVGLTLLVVDLLWAGQAQAFFCMSFGGGSEGRGFGGSPALMAPLAPPRFAAPAGPLWTPHGERRAPAPAADTRRPEPELVEWPVRKNGRLTQTQYRFRPLESRRRAPVESGARDARR
jgi:hypothetical protein